MDHVTNSSSSNVKGYLQNARKRLLTSRLGEEGGRGTRRTRVHVTAAEHTRLSDIAPKDEGEPRAAASAVETNVVQDDDGDEWDVVTFTKTEPVVKPDASVSPQVKGEAQEEPVPLEAPVNRDIAAAHLKSVKNTNFATSFTKLLLHVHQGRTYFREAHHPMLWRGLLKVPAFRRSLGEKFKVIQRLKKDLKNPEIRPSLKPAWVSHSKDMVNNKTSFLTKELLACMSKAFPMVSPLSQDQNADTPIPKQSLLRALAHPEEDGTVKLQFILHYSVIFLALCNWVGLRSRLVFTFQTHDPFSTVRNEQRPGSATAWCWCEVWCPIRECFVSVNVSPSLSSSWGAIYSFAFGGDHVEDVTARYVSRWSSIYPKRVEAMHVTRGYIFQDIDKEECYQSKNPDAEYCITRLLGHLNEEKSQSDFTRKILAREKKQLDALKYAEPVPTTFAAAKRHPLYVLEQDIGKFEGIYPKDASTQVGLIRNRPVYKRTAVVPLRGEDGWIREGRSIRSGEAAYRSVAMSNRLPHADGVKLYGYWQTEPFHPKQLTSLDQPIPKHRTTNWYVLLDKPCPEGLTHIKKVHIARVVRRMGIDFAFAVTGFDRRDDGRFRKSWVARTEGVVVKTSAVSVVNRAYEQWIDLQELQYRKKRRQICLGWWLLFARRLLAVSRLEGGL